jgi:Spy/CpxP family protein refolding chaperone
MSFISSVASSSIFATTIANSTTSSLRPFANLDLTEQQRTQIRAIFQQAKSQGLSQTQIQQQINAILTPAQQTTLQNDIAQFQSQNASSTANSSSTSSQTQAPPNPFADPNGPFANLNLTASQQSQIAQILQSAPSQGLTFDQVNSQISAILTTAQQTTFQSDLKNLPPPPQGGRPPGPPPGPPPGSNSSSSSSSTSTSSSSTTDALDNLTLTTTQQSQIDQILQEAQSGTITQAQALAQITSLLTPAQQTLLQQDEQTAQTQVSGRRHRGDDTSSTSSSTSVATLPSGVTETDIQNQVAAATSVILNQLQYEVSGA